MKLESHDRIDLVEQQRRVVRHARALLHQRPGRYPVNTANAREGEKNLRRRIQSSRPRRERRPESLGRQPRHGRRRRPVQHRVQDGQQFRSRRLPSSMRTGSSPVVMLDAAARHTGNARVRYIIAPRCCRAASVRPCRCGRLISMARLAGCLANMGGRRSATR